ncbi:alpha-L-rhamnosidase [Sphingomonas sp. R86520]|uniref:MGH1-like glycoside hydrolase domain-containing protein n=1 Tax=Sphingomonas sp. R86520 TaxID=3093859 RepID=UPI0036D359B0
MMDRRFFLAASASGAAALALPASAAASGAPRFKTANARWQAAYDKALTVLAGNVRVMPYIDQPVLIEGSVYRGIWQECGPHEALVYRKFRADVARDSHLTFFDLQRADGQLPANNKETETGFGQIQMVVPIAATAWELARATGDEALLRTAYASGSAWDGWLMRYRNTRGTGLVEGFCTYDTGHDNSPRWRGIPNQCPNKNAKTHAPIASLPRLCPDLSATVYGGRKALAAMALALGRSDEADAWTERAERLRKVILARLWFADDAAFYDRDAQDRFVRIRSDILTRMCGEHVPDQAMFDQIWQRQLGNPQAFWTRFPLPSIAADDPSFVRPIVANSWGGPAQALTALRAGRWFDHYGRAAEFTTMMNQWCEAIQADMSFRQQIDPETGVFTAGADAPDYSPCALVMVDYTWRLIGVRDENETLEWTIRPDHVAASGATLSMRTDGNAEARIVYRIGGADLTLDARSIARITGGSARLVTDRRGVPKSLIGVDPALQHVVLKIPGRPSLSVDLRANQQVTL